MAFVSIGHAPTRRTALTAAILLSLAVPMYAYAQDGKHHRDTHKEDVTDLDQITVTASGYEQNVKDAPATISVITADQLKSRSYTDVTDALKDVPGIHIQGGGAEQSIMIRGMSSDYTLFLVDGRPMQDNQAFATNGQLAGAPINFLPPLEAIERIEIIRGPASSLYGSDAIGGVVNVITKKVVNKAGGNVTAEYIKAGPGNDVTNDGFQTSVALNLPMIRDVLSLQITGAYQNQDESDFVAGGKSAASDPEFKRRNIAGKFGWRLNEANTFTFGGGHVQQERTHTPGKSLAEGSDLSYTNTLRDNFFITHDGHYGDIAVSSYVNYDTSENPTRVNATTGVGIAFDTWTANTQATWFGENQTLVAGLNYKNENLRDGATNGLKLPGISMPTDIIQMERYQYAAFVEDNWRLADSFALLLSGRYDYNQAFGGHFSPKLYGVYNLTENFTLKGGVTSGYKAPSLRQSATDFGSTSMGGVIIGNPNLKPETSTNYEIGFAYDNRDAGITTSLTVYRSDFEDKLLRTGRICAANEACVWGGITYPAHQYGYTTTENIDEARLQGVEATLDWKPIKSITVRGSYTYAESEQLSGTYKGSPLNDIPEHMLNASLDWQANQRWRLWTQANYRSETSGRAVAASGSQTNGEKYPPYTFFDMGFVYKPKRNLSLKFGVYNVGNKEVTPEEGFAYVLDGRRFSASMSVDF